jgi:hypothetical protein
MVHPRRLGLVECPRIDSTDWDVYCCQTGREGSCAGNASVGREGSSAYTTALAAVRSWLMGDVGRVRTRLVAARRWCRPGVSRGSVKRATAAR